MKITSLEIENFKTIKEFSQSNIQSGITSIVGNNGVGKSTLMLAVAYAFYGPEVLETGTQDVVSWGERTAKVVVNFTTNSDDYQLSRSHTTHTAKAKLLRNGTQIADTANAVTNEIERLVGIDRVGFLASVFSRQEDLLGIGSLQPAKRMSTILRLLGIDQIERGIKNLSAKRKDASQELEALRFSMPSEIESESDLLQKISESFQLLTTCKENYEHLQDEIKNEQDKLESLSRQVIAFEEYDKQRQLFQSKIDAYSIMSYDKKEPLQPDNFIDPRDYERERDKYTQALDQYNQAIVSAVCPTCKRPFNQEYDKEHLDEQKGLLDHWLSDLTDQFPDYVSSMAYVKERDSYLSRLQDAEKAAKEVESAEQGLSLLSPVEDRRADYRTTQEHILHLLSEDSSLRAEIARLSGEQTHLEYRRTIVEHHSHNLSKVKELEDRVLEFSITLSQMQELKGKMIKSAVPFVSDTASRYVADLTEGKYTELVLTSQYDIQYRNEFGDLKSFGNLSGGEKDVFALALRLAIADLRASSIGILVLDEVFESLDPDRQEATWNLLQTLSNKYEQVFTVTHVPMFKDRAPHTIIL